MSSRRTIQLADGRNVVVSGTLADWFKAACAGRGTMREWASYALEALLAFWNEERHPLLDEVAEQTIAQFIRQTDPSMSESAVALVVESWKDQAWDD